MSRMVAHSVTRANVEHVVQNLRAADRDELLDQVHGDELDVIVDETMRNFGLTFVFGREEPIACIGATLRHPGVWQGWMFSTDRFAEIALPMTRFARRILIPHLMANGHRCQSIASVKNVEACRWLAVLGGEKEAILSRYGRSGNDFVMFRVVADV